jgi:hypothetical protein
MQISEIEKENKSLFDQLTNISYNQKDQVKGKVSISEKQNFDEYEYSYPLFFVIFVASFGILLGGVVSKFLIKN